MDVDDASPIDTMSYQEKKKKTARNGLPFFFFFFGVVGH
jgi:hypothetical protein